MDGQTDGRCAKLNVASWGGPHITAAAVAGVITLLYTQKPSFCAL